MSYIMRSHYTLDAWQVSHALLRWATGIVVILVILQFMKSEWILWDQVSSLILWLIMLKAPLVLSIGVILCEGELVLWVIHLLRVEALSQEYRKMVKDLFWPKSQFSSKLPHSSKYFQLTRCYQNASFLYSICYRFFLWVMNIPLL